MGKEKAPERSGASVSNVLPSPTYPLYSTRPL